MFLFAEYCFCNVIQYTTIRTLIWLFNSRSTTQIQQHDLHYSPKSYRWVYDMWNQVAAKTCVRSASVALSVLFNLEPISCINTTSLPYLFTLFILYFSLQVFVRIKAFPCNYLAIGFDCNKEVELFRIFSEEFSDKTIWKKWEVFIDNNQIECSLLEKVSIENWIVWMNHAIFSFNRE